MRVVPHVPERGDHNGVASDSRRRAHMRPLCGACEVIFCDYCDQEATLVSAVATNEPLCQRCARDHYGADWRIDTRKLGVRARREIEERAKWRA